MWHDVSEIVGEGWDLLGGGRLLDIGACCVEDFDDLTEDLFRIERKGSQHLLSVGWFPGGDQKGHYRAVHFLTDYNTPRSEVTTREYLIVKSWLSAIMKRIDDAPAFYERPM